MNKLKVMTKQNEIDKIIFAGFGALLGTTTLALLSLTALSVSATPVTGTCVRAQEGDACTATASATASVNVAAACTLSTDSSGSYSANLNPGNSVEISGSTLDIICNDPGGYGLYAVGATGDTIGNNVLVSEEGSAYNIATGTATTGGTSAWAMKVNSLSGDYAPTIVNDFDDYHDVPASYTKVASYPASTELSESSVSTSYQVYAAAAQAAGNYNSKVKYVMVHPSAATVATAEEGLNSDADSDTETYADTNLEEQP